MMHPASTGRTTVDAPGRFRPVWLNTPVRRRRNLRVAGFVDAKIRSSPRIWKKDAPRWTFPREIRTKATKTATERGAAAAENVAQSVLRRRMGRRRLWQSLLLLGRSDLTSSATQAPALSDL